MTTPLHSRADWGARAARSRPARIDSEGITAHYHGDSPWGTSVDRSSPERFEATADHNRCATTVRGTQAFHMDGRGWIDGAYTSVVCPHGHRYDMRGSGARTAANGTNDGNDRSEAVCYLAGGDDPLTEPAKHAYHDEAARFGRPLRWNHSNWKPTSCAGSAIKTWQSQGWPRPRPHEEEPDMDARQDQMLGEIYQAVVGSDLQALGSANPRHNSISTRLKYLFGEAIGGSNLGEFRALLDNAVKDSKSIEDIMAKLDTMAAGEVRVT